jgi:hypothetical protein
MNHSYYGMFYNQTQTLLKLQTAIFYWYIARTMKKVAPINDLTRFLNNHYAKVNGFGMYL